jgi:hypothetical protein
MMRKNCLGGVFESRGSAERARDDLIAAGIPSDKIEIVTPEDSARPFPTEHAPPKLRERGDAALGGLIGCIIGCLLGTLLATGAFPGTTPLMGDGGGLSAVLGAIVGIVIGGAIGAVIAWAIAADQESFYAHEIQAGRTVLLVHSRDREADAVTVLRRNGAARLLGVQEELVHHGA